MGMMAQMRSMASWFIVTVGVLFVAFMVLSDSKCSEAASRGNNNVGEINGKAVTYQEFSSLVEQYRNGKRVFLEPFSHILLYKIDCLNLNEKEYINKSLKLIKQFYDSKITNYELLAKLSKLDLEHTLYKIKR